MLVQATAGTTDSRIAILDRTGNELAGVQFQGMPVMDSGCSIVAAVATSQAMHLNEGADLSVMVWWPEDNREKLMFLSTSSMLNYLRSTATE